MERIKLQNPHIMRRLLLLFIVILAGLESRAGRSSISGHIKTASGKAVDSVLVQLEAAGGWRFKVLADRNGYFSVTGLDAKHYTVTFSRRGFESHRYLDVHIDSGKVAHLGLEAVLVGAPEQDTRITTSVYQQQSAREIEPGHWVARDRNPRPKPTAPKLQSNATNHIRLEGTTVKATRAYVAPLIDPKEPGGRSVKTAEYIVSETSLKSEERLVPADAKAGSLTSGEINDFAKWKLWEDVSYHQLADYQKAWAIRAEKRVSVLVKAANGMPLPNAAVTLFYGTSKVWDARTDNTGKAELWYDIFGAENSFQEFLRLRVRAGGAEQFMDAPKGFDSGINVFRTGIPCLNPQKVDVAFLVDATGSMGDEISYLQAELGDILRRMSDSMPLTHIRTGAVFYRDRGDAYLVRSSMLTDSFGLTQDFIGSNSADGGGDGPEAVESALEAGLELGWRPDATARIAFLVLDAPPHGDSVTFARMEALIRSYAARGIRLVPVACSGSDKPTEFLLRSMALATNGTYLFLTDHSGIGGTHTAPTTDRFDVEYLNQLIYRVIHNFSAMPDCEVQQLASLDSAGGSADGKHTAWRFYPNPTQDVLHVDHDEKTGYLYVTDISGKLVQRIAVSAGGHSMVDMHQFPAGLYSIRHSWGSDKEVAGTFVLRH